MKCNTQLGQTKLITFLREKSIDHDIESDTVGVSVTVDEKSLSNEHFEFLFLEQGFATKKGKLTKTFHRLTLK